MYKHFRVKSGRLISQPSSSESEMYEPKSKNVTPKLFEGCLKWPVMLQRSDEAIIMQVRFYSASSSNASPRRINPSKTTIRPHCFPLPRKKLFNFFYLNRKLVTPRGVFKNFISKHRAIATKRVDFSKHHDSPLFPQSSFTRLESAWKKSWWI